MLKKIELLILVVLIVGDFSACKFDLPTSPDSPQGRNDGVAKTMWSPYIGVHAFGPEIQKPHLLKLIQAGVLRGVRLENLDNPDIQRFAAWFQGQGVEVLGLFENEHLRKPNVCKIFSQHVAQNPGVLVWEIGNEVQGFIGMSSEEYMQIVTPLFYYVKQNYPQIKLAIGAVAGNGGSADDLRRMIDAGLKKLCQDGLEIVPIHFYSSSSTRLHEFKSQLSRLPISTRIWITETNDMPPNWSAQIRYVTEMYSRLRSALKAERIYWYVFSERSDFSLVKGLPDGLPAEYSPLMKLLIGTFDDFGENYPEILLDITPGLPDSKDRDVRFRRNNKKRRRQ